MSEEGKNLDSAMVIDKGEEDKGPASQSRTRGSQRKKKTSETQNQSNKKSNNSNTPKRIKNMKLSSTLITPGKSKQPRPFTRFIERDVEAYNMAEYNGDKGSSKVITRTVAEETNYF